MKRLFVQSFGCQMSVADGEEMARPLLRRGVRPTETLEEADAVILNTCTVRQHAEDRALSFIGRLKPWKDARPDRFLIVAGCAAERLGPWLRTRFPHIDLVVGAKSIEQYPEMLDQAFESKFAREEALATFVTPAPSRNMRSGTAGEENGLPAAQAAGEDTPASKASAYVTIMRGCNYSCTYCIVPAVRGRELYRPMATIVAEIRERVEAGAKEVVLLGQTVNSYRSDGADFADLLRAADGVDGLARIRFMSPHPFFVNERMVQAMAECPKVCRHLHLPLQSGSNALLRRMRRNYTVEEFLAKVERLRRAVPGIVFTTDVIAGFPGETETDFEATLAALEAFDPSSAYCFKYSARPGTEAAAFEEQLPEAVIEERQKRLLKSVESRMENHLRGWIGREVEVLLDDERNGHIEHYFSARLDAPARAGELVSCVVTGMCRTGLEAHKTVEAGIES